MTVFLDGHTMPDLRIQKEMQGTAAGQQAIVTLFIQVEIVVRFEKLREGIVDFEKIRMLKEEAIASKDKSIQNLWKKFSDHLGVFAKEKHFNSKKITADVDHGKALMEELTDKLTGIR
jgi:hypothetical protein